MSARNIPGGKGVRLTTYRHIVPMPKTSRRLNFLDLSGPAWPVMGVLYLYLLNKSVTPYILNRGKDGRQSI